MKDNKQENDFTPQSEARELHTDDVLSPNRESGYIPQSGGYETPRLNSNGEVIGSIGQGYNTFFMDKNNTFRDENLKASPVAKINSLEEKVESLNCQLVF